MNEPENTSNTTEINIRETNNNKQIQIIEDLIYKKNNQISNVIGNLSLEDATNIIGKEYINVKSNINELNNLIDNFQKEIKSKKVLIKNLQMEKDTILEREKNILNKELNRIEIKNKESLENNKKLLSETLDTLHSLLNEERELETIIREKENYIKTFKYNRAKLRKLHIEKINNQHLEHKKRQGIKTELEYQLLVLQGQLNEIENNINSYEVLRHDINQDYYNWKNENKITMDIIINLQKEITLYLTTNNFDVIDVNEIINTNINFNTNTIVTNNDTRIDKNVIWNKDIVNKLTHILHNKISNTLDNITINFDNSFIIDKLNRLPQLINILTNLDSDSRKNTTSRYARLEINHKKNIKRQSRLKKIITKFQNELQETTLFKKVVVNAFNLTEDENEYNSSKDVIQKCNQNLKKIKGEIILISSKVKTIENEISFLNEKSLSETLQKDKDRCLSRWEKMGSRCESQYDVKCNSLGEDIGLLFKKINDLTVTLTQKESRWTVINNNPSIILEEYHNLNNTNIDSISNINRKQQQIIDIKSDIMEIINMKKTISRIQSNR